MACADVHTAPQPELVLVEPAEATTRNEEFSGNMMRNKRANGSHSMRTT